MTIHESALEAVGRTPLVRLGRVAQGCGATVLAKLEARNPGGSVKCRIGVALIRDAEARGLLRPGFRERRVVEPTSGNTGIALAFVCAVRGYPLTLTMPEFMSLERRRLLEAFGAELLLTPSAEGMPGAIARAESLVASDPERYWMPQQFRNPANPEAHARSTGPELWTDAEGNLDALVAGIGTGGTITGAGRFLRSQRPDIRLVGVEPAESGVLTALRVGREPRPAAHGIQGIGAGFKPEVLDLDLLDEVQAVSTDEAITMARRLHREEGLSCGISSGAAVVAALRVASCPALSGGRVAVILPDSGERYLSTALFSSPLT